MANIIKEPQKIKPTWQFLRRLIIGLTKEDTRENLLRKTADFREYANYLLTPAYESLDVLDNYFLYKIYNLTGFSETISQSREQTFWVSLWGNFLKYSGCYFCPFYPEEYSLGKPDEHPNFCTDKDIKQKILNLRRKKLRSIFSQRLKRMVAHGYIDLKIDWEVIELIETTFTPCIFEYWLIKTRITKQGYNYLQTTGYPMKLFPHSITRNLVEFVPPEKYVDNIKESLFHQNNAIALPLM